MALPEGQRRCRGRGGHPGGSRTNPGGRSCPTCPRPAAGSCTLGSAPTLPQTLSTTRDGGCQGTERPLCDRRWFGGFDNHYFAALRQRCKEGLLVPEPQRGPITGLWSHSWPVAGLRSKPSQPELGAGARRGFSPASCPREQNGGLRREWACGLASREGTSREWGKLESGQRSTEGNHLETWELCSAGMGGRGLLPPPWDGGMSTWPSTRQGAVVASVWAGVSTGREGAAWGAPVGVESGSTSPKAAERTYVAEARQLAPNLLGDLG